ncbi:dephospho-CoA kinase [Xanthovirga aplysinae]|uniref:dephospho-CoA kinase n=1 Tax=Xanthovirga aplysinae TaxID=2529853 RepID=UPI0012BC1B5E|nr:dephospho-CoA kinase [Xanthovirga aplysinae]MTI33361.1 dephospho-CoA kinase [Xanthovirga aplysinae]
MPKRSSVLEVGITGGIGAGKSVVCEIFKSLGIPIYDADSRSKWLLGNDEKLKHQLKETFGAKAFTPDDLLNRIFLAEEVFHNPQQLEKLNRLVHPRVGEDYEDWVKQHQAAPYVLKEAALLIEAGSYRRLDFLITVNAPEDLRIERIKARDPQRSMEQIAAIIKKQLSEEERQEIADFVIDNSGTRLLIPQVVKLHRFFCEKGKR